MVPSFRAIGLVTATCVALTLGCTADPESGSGEPRYRTELRGEHDREGIDFDREGSEEHGAEGEETGTELALTATHDAVRNGVRLILAYDAGSNAFVGAVENTTGATLRQVRVEVHLSNGKELGPTMPLDLAPGGKQPIELTATSRDFERWTAHPEVGSGEHR